MQAATAAAAASTCTAKTLLPHRVLQILRLKSQYKISSDPLKRMESMAVKWAEKTAVITPKKRDCHLITAKVLLSSVSPSCTCHRYLSNVYLPKKVKDHNKTSESTAAESMAAKWAQKTVVITPKKRGCHLITPEILKEIELDLPGFKRGLAHLCLQETSASLTINEKSDSDLLEGPPAPWRHTLEGPDDLPAHMRSTMFRCFLTIPITDGTLNIRTGKEIWLCEHRDDSATPRKILVTLNEE